MLFHVLGLWLLGQSDDEAGTMCKELQIFGSEGKVRPNKDNDLGFAGKTLAA